MKDILYWNYFTLFKTNFKQTLRIMKMTVMLVFVFASALLATEASSQMAKVSIVAKKTTAQTIIYEIEKQTDYLFIYDESEVNLNQITSLKAENKTVSEVLDKVFEGTYVSYAIEGSNIMLMKKTSVTQQKPTKKISGIVLDITGVPVIGASIMEVGTSNGTITDLDGKFSLTISESSKLMISYIGYLTQTITVGDRSQFDIKLVEDSQKLDEVIVVGYGTNTKRSLISSVSTVDASEIKNIPVTNITQGLAGRSPGLIVQASGGGVNKTSQISIRGGETPLVVIDGIIRAYNDFVALSPDDIENLAILKDASATAVYGSRAANGILQVTTKRGKLGSKPMVEYNFNQSFSQPNIWPKKLNSYDRAYYMNFAAKSDGLSTLPFSDDDLNKFKDGSDPFGHADVDWQSLVLKDYAPQQKHNIKMSGGSETNNYFVSLGYIDQGSLYRNDSHEMQRTNFRLNQSSVVKAIGLKTTAQIDGYVQETTHPYTSTSNSYYNVFSHIQNKKPWDLAQNSFGDIYAASDNPLAETSKDGGYLLGKQKVANGLLAFDWSLPWVKGLSLKANGNYRYVSYENKQWRKDPPQFEWEGTDPVAGSKSQLYKSTENENSYTLQFFVNYEKTIKQHSFSLLGGYEATYGFASSLWGSRDTYQFDIDQMNAGPESTMKNNGGESEYGRAGWIGQLKYNYADKYFAEASIRYDGSDNFPVNKRWGTFYSGSIGWSVADEAFFESLKEKNIFNTLKLRASYGKVGLDNWSGTYAISRFAYLSSYSYSGQAYVINNIMQPGFSEGAIPSPDLTWFTTDQLDYGIDFSSLNSRLYGSVDYFFYKTKGFLYQPDQLQTGYVDPLGTGLPKVSTDGEHRRAGWEFQLGYRNQLGQLEYDFAFNFTAFNSLWAKDPSESLDSKKNPYKRTTQEKGYWGIGYENDGLYSGPDDIYSSVKRLNSTNLTSGDIKYSDFNGDGVIDGQDQIRIGNNSFPRGNFGLNIGLRYQGFFLNALFQGATEFDMYMGSAIMMNDSQTGTTPIYDFQTDFWRLDNTDAKYPRIISSGGVNGNNNAVTSDYWLINGAYLRLKDVQFGYDFKKKLLKNTPWISQLTLALSGQNIFTISEATKYGMDPENSSTNNYGYPMERVFAFSLNVGF